MLFFRSLAMAAPAVRRASRREGIAVLAQLRLGIKLPSLKLNIMEGLRQNS